MPRDRAMKDARLQIVRRGRAELDAGRGRRAAALHRRAGHRPAPADQDALAFAGAKTGAISPRA